MTTPMALPFVFLFPLTCLTANLYPSESDSLGGLAEPGGSLAYTWKEGSHEVVVATMKGREDCVLGAIPFPLLEESHSRFLKQYGAGAVPNFVLMGLYCCKNSNITDPLQANHLPPNNIFPSFLLMSLQEVLCCGMTKCQAMH